MSGMKGEKLSGKTLLKFAYGDLIEALVIALSEAAGHEISRFQEEVNVDGIKGHIDFVLDGVLVDVKSCSSYSFNKFKDGGLLEAGNDAFGYVAQLSGYAHALELPAAWIAINKVDGEVCILELPKERIDQYDVKTRISTVREAISNTTPPARCYEDEDDGKSGNRKLGIGCSYCAYKSSCWGDANGGQGLRIFLYSTGPRFLTNVSVEPKVFEITKKEEHN
jgi:hypothetical protein